MGQKHKGGEMTEEIARYGGLSMAELKDRQTSIGASDAGPALGLSKWKTPYQLWQEKTVSEIIQFDNPILKRGRMFEPILRQMYSDETGRAVKKVPKMTSEKYPFMSASPDGYAEDGKRYIEIKTARNKREWGEPGSDEVPLSYMIQVQHGLVVTGLEVADIPVSFSLDDFAIYEVPADKELQEMIIEKEAAFWELVKNRIPPEPSNYVDVYRRFAQSMPKSIQADTDIVGAIQSLKSIKLSQKDLKEREDQLKTMIGKFMAESDTLIDFDGNTLATWRTQNKKSYVVKESSSRVFRIKGE